MSAGERHRLTRGSEADEKAQTSSCCRNGRTAGKHRAQRVRRRRSNSNFDRAIDRRRLRTLKRRGIMGDGAGCCWSWGEDRKRRSRRLAFVSSSLLTTHQELLQGTAEEGCFNACSQACFFLHVRVQRVSLWLLFLSSPQPDAPVATRSPAHRQLSPARFPKPSSRRPRRRRPALSCCRSSVCRGPAALR